MKGTMKKQNRVLTINACGQALIACPSFADMQDACVLICCFFHLAGKISMHVIF